LEEWLLIADTLGQVIELRQMATDDLAFVARWLREPHVARWWLPDTTPEAELDKLSAWLSGTGDQMTQMLTVVERRDGEAACARPIGWCQWYPYDAYPDEAVALGAEAGDCGIDYAIGEPDAVRHGLGRQLIAVLVAEVRRHHPGCGVIADPDARNRASRGVLERNGFSLIAVRAVASELNENPMAIYRLPGTAGRSS
jgi:aminoglycoside 6'-N-acetyltransferase